MTSKFDTVFKSIPEELCQRLDEHYHRIKLNFARGHFEPTELNGGKFCEIVLRILEWYTQQNYTPLGKSISDFPTATRQFIDKSAFNDSIRFHIPQVLNALYPIRNKRGVAHHAGEIDSNHMDAALVVSCADWVMAELVRIFHNVSIDEAKAIVESLITKQIPVIWQIGEHKRVLSPPGIILNSSKKILLLLYNASPQPVSVNDLIKWTEYDPKNKSRFRVSVLKDLHRADLIHFDSENDNAILSPLGIRHVEQELPLNFEV